MNTLKPPRFPSAELIPSANDENLVDAGREDYLDDFEDALEDSDVDLEEFARARVETLRGLAKGKRGRNRARIDAEAGRYLQLAEYAKSFSESLHDQALAGKTLEFVF